MKLIQCICDNRHAPVGITSYHQMIVLRVQTFNIKHSLTRTTFLTEFNTLVTKFKKSSNQQLPVNVKLMFLQDAAPQDQELENSGSPRSPPTYAKFYQLLTLRLDIVDAPNTKRLTGHQEAYQHAMDLHGH